MYLIQNLQILKNIYTLKKKDSELLEEESIQIIKDNQELIEKFCRIVCGGIVN